MALTDQVNPFHIRAAPGQDTADRDTLLENKRVERVENGRYGKEHGSVEKRPPMAFYNGTTLGTSSIHSAYRYYTTSSQFLLIGYEGTVKVGSDAAGTFSNLVTGLTSGKKLTFVTYNDLCIFSNGFDNVYQTDGAAAWELGACKAAIGSGSGNLDQDDYYYAVTIDADAYICGAVSNTITCDASNQKIELSNIPLGPVGTANRKIFRTEGGGSTLKLLATISDNTTTTYSDNIADGSLGADMGAVTDDFPKGKYLNTYRERLLIAEGNATSNRIYYSNPNLPHYIQGTSNTDYVDVSPNDGDSITGIPIQLGTVCVFKRNNIRKWNIDDANVDDWFMDDPISFQGSPAPYSITQTPYGILYQGWDHLYNFDGAHSRQIINEFHVVEDVAEETLRESVGHWNKSAYYLSYVSASAGSSVQDKLMIYEWNQDAVNIDTVSVASFASFRGGTEANTLYYGASQGGYVYLAENYLKAYKYTTKTQLNGGQPYPTVIDSGLDDIQLSGTEESPIVRLGWTVTIDNASGTIDAGYSGTATIDVKDTAGVYTSSVFNLNASKLGRLYWNEILPAGCTLTADTRTGATEAACLAASWDAGLTTPGGSVIASTADKFFQFRFNLGTSDLTLSPSIVKRGGYVIRFTYTPGGTELTDSIPFAYGTGRRNFGHPHLDKVFKKVAVIFGGDTGNFELAWETDTGYSGSFTVDMSVSQKHWEAFLPDTAYGREIEFTVTKDDTDELTVKEILGLWTPRPLLI